jgi:phytoene synthase
MSSLAADHAACAALLRQSGSSFALPIRLLPEAKRRGTTAVYAFCRLADDLVDDAPDVVAARCGLDAFSARMEAALAGERSSEPVLRALVDTVRRFAVPAEHLRDVIAGVRMDLDQASYGTFVDLEEYCRRVASAVGLAAIHIWGFRSPAAVEAGHHCGLAFQLTNILRDIPEDLGRGRIYLPHADIETCGCTAADLQAGRIGPEFRRLADLQIDRIAACYDRAAALDDLLSTDGRMVFRAMFGVYRSLFAAVRRAGTTIFTARVRPARPRMLASAAATLCLGPRPMRGLWS